MVAAVVLPPQHQQCLSPVWADKHLSNPARFKMSGTWKVFCRHKQGLVLLSVAVFYVDFFAPLLTRMI